MSIDPYRIRPASAADAAVIARHRLLMFRDMGLLNDQEPDALERASRDYLARALPDGRYRGWLVERDACVVAGGGLILRQLLPRPGHPVGGTEAYVLNVYTDVAHRRRGLARALLHAILAQCGAEGIARTTLHASDAGRSLYESLGFIATNEMCRVEGEPVRR
jgi:ribosomal protein S18 acetylase RimI-like enzyme